VRVYDLITGVVRHTLRGHKRTVWAVRWAPASMGSVQLLASGCLAGEVRIWALPTARVIVQKDFGQSIACVSFDPTGGVIAVAAGSAVTLWRWASGETVRVDVHGHVRCAFFLSTGSLATAITDDAADTSSPLNALHAHSAARFPRLMFAAPQLRHSRLATTLQLWAVKDGVINPSGMHKQF